MKRLIIPLVVLSLTACGAQPQQSAAPEVNEGLPGRQNYAVPQDDSAPERTAAPLTTLAAPKPTPTPSSEKATPSSEKTVPGRKSRGEKSPTCTTMGVVGDSTGITLIDENDSTVSTQEDFPLTNALRDKDVQTIRYDILGGRSFYEGNEGTNGIDALERINKDNPDCYTIIMGTNDAANIAVGSNYSSWRRIKDVLDNTGDKPVYWASPVIASFANVNGYGSEIADDFTDNLRKQKPDDGGKRTPWDSRLHLIDMRKYLGKHGDVDSFFVEDGIHYPAGDVAALRSQAIADAL